MELEFIHAIQYEKFTFIYQQEMCITNLFKIYTCRYTWVFGDQSNKESHSRPSLGNVGKINLL